MNMRKKFGKLVLILISLILVLSACGDKSSTEEISENKYNTVENGVLTVGFCATWPPFEYRDNNGDLVGFDVDLAKEIAKDLGLEIKFCDADYQGLIPSLQKGDYDIVISCLAKSESREETISFTKKYYNNPSSIIVMKNNNDIKSIEDLAGKVIGVQYGTADEMIANSLNTDYNFKELKTYKLPPDEMLDMSQGKIDAVIVSLAYSLNQVKQSSNFKILDSTFGDKEIAAAVNKSNIILLEAVNKSIERIYEDGTYDKLNDTWLSVK